MKTGENRQHDLSSRDTISRVIVKLKGVRRQSSLVISNLNHKELLCDVRLRE